MVMKHRRVTALPGSIEADTTYYVLDGIGFCSIHVVGDDYGVRVANRGPQGAQGDTGPQGEPVDTSNLALNGGDF